jgi:hypothetical protein
MITVGADGLRLQAAAELFVDQLNRQLHMHGKASLCEQLRLDTVLDALRIANDADKVFYEVRFKTMPKAAMYVGRAKLIVSELDVKYSRLDETIDRERTARWMIVDSIVRLDAYRSQSLCVFYDVNVRHICICRPMFGIVFEIALKIYDYFKSYIYWIF